MALPLVAPALLGVNATIFAYGVTSSGKTHTMMGTQAVRWPPEDGLQCTDVTLTACEN